MRVLLSTIGSRGDVQPLVALALQLRALNQDVQLCVPPDFQAWIESLEMSVTPIGPEVRSTAKANPAAAPPTPEQREQMMNAMVANQFETIAKAALGCDAIVGATALQIAAPSVAELLGIPYVFAAYCPAVLPSVHHGPPVLTMRGDVPAQSRDEYAALWARDSERFASLFGGALNSHRATLGLPGLSDVRSHIFTDRPWLAADVALGPWPDPVDASVFQTGAWIVEDDRPLSAQLEAFLDAGEAPVYFGFGSMRTPEALGHTMVASARALGRRAVVLRGWGEVSLPDAAADCLVVDEVNQQALFKRVAVVVHHGGAGTTTAAARAGVPQVVIPQMYDQHYWAERVDALGIGTAHQRGTPTTDSLTVGLDRVLTPEVVRQARAFAREVRSDGARVAAERLVSDA